MKCPVCQAQLMPVAGEMFCLQCGEAVQAQAPSDDGTISLTATTDPILRRAILDATDGEVNFDVVAEVIAAPVEVAKQPVAAPVAVKQPVVTPVVIKQPTITPVAASKPALVAAPAAAVTAPPKPETPKHTFASLRSVLAPPRPMLATAGGAGVVPGGIGPAPEQFVAPKADAESKPAGTAELAQNAVVAEAPLDRPVRSKAMMIAWGSGVIGLVLFVAANMLVGNYYADRVYPGIRVGNVAVGGLRFDQLDQALAQSLPQPKLVAVVDKDRVLLDTAHLGALRLDDVKRTAQSAGRSPMLPIAAAVESWFSNPIAVRYEINESALTGAVSTLSASVDRPAVSAVPMVSGTNVLVIPDRTGRRLDKTAAIAAIRSAYGHAGSVTLTPEKLAPKVVAADYNDEVAQAQSVMNVSVAVMVRNVRYAPTAEQVGQWLVFDPAGKGVSVDAASVAAYVQAIPGSFDKLAAYSAMVGGLNARRAVAVAPSIKKSTEVPAVAHVAAAFPLAEYSYCADETSGLAAVSGPIMNSATGWGIGGRLRYVPVVSGCSFRLQLAHPAAMKALDPACEHQTSCRIHNNLAIAQASWNTAPADWKGDLAGYRTELINQVLGQWLGFDHPACTAVATQTPVLQSPSLMVPGCSPKWYAVPSELQDTKVLAGF